MSRLHLWFWIVVLDGVSAAIGRDTWHEMRYHVGGAAIALLLHSQVGPEEDVHG